jgi:hypothetical protein
VIQKLKIPVMMLLGALLLAMSAKAQVFVKKDTTISYTVNRLSPTEVKNYIWNVSPGGSSSVMGTDSVQTIRWDGLIDKIYTLSVTPVSFNDCAGDPKSVSVRLYANADSLPLIMAWGPPPDSICPVPGGIPTVTALLSATSGTYSGLYSIYYKVDYGKEKPYGSVLNTAAQASVILNDTELAGNGVHEIRITRVIAGSIVQTYDDTDAPMLKITIKPSPSIGDIQF